ncbi:hypothetical protein Tfer_2040 [Thermincola ferriacetica]|uniref:Uncharacterized protein n=1 Tax=Thermincola ferriacetica TaxID=281456 RepID=A0A0L6W1P8_9FIRM|nr:hypothetical protein [Thermincola ferriacetica]KNZ69401.1 hypothetical protein Tfer_2040 [Thermincola ferriacetica]
MKQWLTLKEIEESWGYSADFLKYLIYSKRLPAMKSRRPGAPIVIREDWWEKFCTAVDLLLELSTTAVALDSLPVKKNRYGRGDGLHFAEDFPNDARFDQLLEMQSLVATAVTLTNKDVDKLYKEVIAR